MKKILFKDYPDTTTPIDADNLNLLQDNIETEIIKIDNMTKYITATADSNGDFSVDIDGADGLANGDTLKISFPVATNPDSNARLSIDDGVTYKNIKYLTGGENIISRLIETNQLELIYDGTDFLIKKGSQPTLLWSGSLAVGQTATLTESCLKYKYLLIRQGNLGSKAMCPVLTDSTRVIGVSAFVSTTGMELIVPRTRRNAEGTQLTLEAASIVRVTLSTGAVSQVTGFDNITEVWGVS